MPSKPTHLIYQAEDENGDRAQGNNDGNLDFHDAKAAVCYCHDTLITTPDGARLVQSLLAGDLVVTRDHGAQPLRWTGQQVLDAATLRAAPHLRPILIAAGALANGVPCQDLRVSPQHRILMQSRIANRMTSAAEVLIAARHLCGLPGIAEDAAHEPLSYHPLLFDRDEVMLANGAAVQSLFVGAQALRALPRKACAEIAAPFAQLIRAADPRSAARLLMTGRQGRKLVLLHLKSRSTCDG